MILSETDDLVLWPCSPNDRTPQSSSLADPSSTAKPSLLARTSSASKRLGRDMWCLPELIFRPRFLSFAHPREFLCDEICISITSIATSQRRSHFLQFHFDVSCNGVARTGKQRSNRSVEDQLICERRS